MNVAIARTTPNLPGQSVKAHCETTMAPNDSWPSNPSSKHHGQWGGAAL